MELFTWFWAFDKRLTCCLKYGTKTFAYIWLIPFVISMGTLALTWGVQLTSDHHQFQDCVAADDDAKKGAHLLQKMMLI